MTELPLACRRGHLFVEADGGAWLLDTGAPASFGVPDRLSLAGREFPLADDYLGMTAEELSGFTGAECRGLLGGDVLGEFDHLLDCPGERLVLSPGELPLPSPGVPLSFVMDVPVVGARVGDEDVNLFFDTGAQLGYLGGEGSGRFPVLGTEEDFYPGVGRFETEVREVELTLGEETFRVRCGRLPVLLEGLLDLAGVDGILGNEVLRDRVAGYFPRRRLLCL